MLQSYNQLGITNNSLKPSSIVSKLAYQMPTQCKDKQIKRVQ